MNLLIDTNVLYFLAGLEPSGHDRQRIRARLSEFEGMFISELTVLDMLVKYSSDQNKLIAATNYIAENRIKVHQILPDEDTIAIKANDPRVVTIEYFNSITADAMALKMRIEAEFATFWFGSISGLLLMILFRLNRDMTDEIKIAVAAQFQMITTTLNSRDGEFQKEIMDALRNFYYHDQRRFKQQLNSFLLEVVEALNTVFEDGKHGVVLAQLPSDSVEYEKLLRRIAEDSAVAKSIKKKKQGRKAALIPKQYASELAGAFASFEANSIGKMDKYLLAYSSRVFRKYLSEKDYRIRKNDIFDSILTEYCSDYIVLTFDKALFATIRSIDVLHEQEYSKLSVWLTSR